MSKAMMQPLAKKFCEQQINLSMEISIN